MTNEELERRVTACEELVRAVQTELESRDCPNEHMIAFGMLISCATILGLLGGLVKQWVTDDDARAARGGTMP